MAQPEKQSLQPTVLVIFGVTGDLTSKKLMPALYQLFQQNSVPEYFKIIGFARRPWDDDELHAQTYNALTEQKVPIDESVWQRMKQTLTYLQAEFTDGYGYQKLKNELDAFEQNVNSCISIIYYFATPASSFQDIIQHIRESQLNRGCPEHGPHETRVVAEKPFGNDLESAQKLNNLFLEAFTEEQIYRIDHYLGKETVQNILAFRFANAIFDPIWNNQYIDHVQITAAEEIGIGSRGAFYEETGALRDFLQNHLLQLVAAVAMEPPASLDAQAVRQQRERIMQSLVPIESIDGQTVRGQYTGYQQEDKVNPHSITETFVAMKLFINTNRFSGVPFYLRTGKKLKEKVTDITIQFNKSSNSLFHMEDESAFPNTITMRIQPNEGISIRLFTKQPGYGNRIVPTQMDFCYATTFGGAGDDAYTRLLYDALTGDQSLFTSTEEIEAAWRFTSPIIHTWRENLQLALPYEPGSWGPKEADNLIEKDGRKWLAQHLIVCAIHPVHIK